MCLFVFIFTMFFGSSIYCHHHSLRCMYVCYTCFNKHRSINQSINQIKTWSPLSLLRQRMIHFTAYLFPWNKVSQPSKRHLDRFSRFFAQLTRVANTQKERQTNRQTDYATLDVCSNRPHLCTSSPCGRSCGRNARS